MDKDDEIKGSEEKHEDLFYHGVIRRLFRRHETGIVRSDSGKDIPFSLPYVTLLGVPKQQMQYLREGMRVGFDVGWTGKGLRVMVIKVYPPAEGQGSEGQGGTEEDEASEELAHHRGEDSDIE